MTMKQLTLCTTNIKAISTRPPRYLNSKTANLESTLRSLQIANIRWTSLAEYEGTHSKERRSAMAFRTFCEKERNETFKKERNEERNGVPTF